MISLTSAQQDAISRGHVMRRLFVWCDALDPSTGAPSPAGFWNDVGTVTVSGRAYHGSGTLIEIEPLAGKSDLTIPGLRITISGLAPETASLVRGSTVAQRPIEVHMGIFDTADERLLPPLVPRFVGKIDDVEIRTPAAGGESTVMLICESTSRALRIRRTGTRSEATQRERHPTDLFYRYTNVQREKPVYFGRKAPKR